jgi:hypothetical protein
MGYDELSTCPTSLFVIAGMPPTISRVALATFQFTLGVCFGTRPYISRSKSSKISGRRLFHQTLAVVTFSPLDNTSGSGSVGCGLAFDSSKFAAWGEAGSGSGPARSEGMCSRSRTRWWSCSAVSSTGGAAVSDPETKPALEINNATTIAAADPARHRTDLHDDRMISTSPRRPVSEHCSRTVCTDPAWCPRSARSG